MKPIVVAVDFTDRSRNAANYAADIALATEADLHVIHSVQMPVTPADMPVGYVFEQAMKSAGPSLESLAEGLRQRTKHQVAVTAVLEVGGLTFRLQELCDRLLPFLIVLGAPADSPHHPTDGPLHALRHLPYPMLLVPPDAVFHAIRKVAIACELPVLHQRMPVSRTFLGHLQDLFNCHFDLLNIKKAGDEARNAEIFELYRWKYAMEDPAAALHFVKAGSVMEGIAGYLRENQVDWLMVFPRRHGMLAFHRSQSRQIVRHCPVPVLSVFESVAEPQPSAKA